MSCFESVNLWEFLGVKVLIFNGYFYKKSVKICHIERSEISQKEIFRLFAKGSK